MQSDTDAKHVVVNDEEQYAISHIDELGEGYGFRKIRKELGVNELGMNAIVMPPGFEGFLHFHDRQDELYFVHRGTARVEVEGEVRELAPGSLFHAKAATRRKISNPSTSEDLVLLVIGGQDGYVPRDGHLVHAEDAERRAAFGRAGS